MFQPIQPYGEVLYKIKMNTKKLLYNKYNWTLEDSQKQSTSDLMTMRKSHDTAKFRDLLFSLDNAEFLRKIYKNREGVIRLSLLSNFYNDNFKFYPNYSKLEEAKYIYEALDNKQRLINQIGVYKFKIKSHYKSSFFDSSLLSEIENEPWNLSKPLEDQLNSSYNLSAFNDKWKIYNKKFDDSLFMLEMLILKIKSHEICGDTTNKELNEEEAINQLLNNQNKRKERLSVLLKEDELYFDEIILNNSKNISYDPFYIKKETKDCKPRSLNKPKIDFSVPSNREINNKSNKSNKSNISNMSNYKLENKKHKQNLHLYRKSAENKLDDIQKMTPPKIEEEFFPIIRKFVPTEKFVKKAKKISSLENKEYKEQLQKVSEEMKCRFSFNSKFKILRMPVDSTIPEGTYTKSGSELYRNTFKIKADNKKNFTLSKNKYNPKETFTSKLKKKIENMKNCMGNVLNRNFQSASLIERLESAKAKRGNNNYVLNKNEKFEKSSYGTDDKKLQNNIIEYKTEGLTLSDLKVTAKRHVVNYDFT
jgi:hypothetical protein